MSKIKRQVAKAVGIGVVAGGAEFATTTGWMHRSLTHKSYTLSKPLELGARTVAWGIGANPRDWAAVHRQHHEFADAEGDPHSPIMQGRWGVLKVLTKNFFMYREATRKLTDTEMPADLQPDALDRLVFDRHGIGIAANLAGHVAVNKAVGNPSYMGLLSFGINKAAYIAGGNFVNSIGHAGKHPWKALFTGKIEPQADGSFGADSALVGALTLGEGNQKFHHEHPQEVLFGPEADLNWPQRALRDIGGTAILALVRIGWASRGSAEPSSLPQIAA